MHSFLRLVTDRMRTGTVVLLLTSLTMTDIITDITEDSLDVRNPKENHIVAVVVVVILLSSGAQQ
jgi:hypothetical protein